MAAQLQSQASQPAAEGRPGRILEVSVAERNAPHFEGRVFGDVGAYEWIAGSVRGELDPAHPLNADITNLDLAPRNASGSVEYRVEFAIAKPIDLAKGSGWLFYEVPNRGTKRALQRVNGGPPTNLPKTAADAGNGFLMHEGHTLVWSGWQGDLVREPGRMVADFPLPSKDGAPVTGVNREEFYLDAPGVLREDINEPIVELSDEKFVAPLHFPAADMADGSATLTVRRLHDDPRETPPGLSWRYVDETHIEITVPEGYERGALYEFIYVAKDPLIAGMGLAAIRDFITFLRHETHDAAGNPNPLLVDGRPTIRRALGFGLSQSGRMLREFLYEGFNHAGGGRAVFDAMIHLVSGTRRGSLNVPFSHATSYSRQHEEQDFVGSQFPFTYDTLTDVISGRTDGLLARARADGVCPRIMHLDTDAELWSARASLLVTDTEGNDIALPEEVRAFYANALPHGPFRIPEVVALTKPSLLSYHCIVRALVKAMREWVDEGVEPPASRFPSRAAGTLVTVEEAAKGYPPIPGTAYPKRMNELSLLDETVQPPRAGGRYPTFVAPVDSDGIAYGGVTHPQLLAPVGTYTGWQIRREGFAGGELYSCYGGYVPFAETKAEREAAGDPRPSLEERYASPADRAAKIRSAAAPLVADRLLLQEDIDRLAEAAEKSFQTEGVI